ncbi:hypothetical protein CABS01_02616 [Colletotrichum abscissum]|uniref:uncharacterized protein n=1 Tax=Colletotrichum abscissum TaxID=1671311 RepID=UPI0027D498E5|nr:uncharacterized protein CABS01_02616 [Colletotrichum abscissum]KAK1482880.1 hypothetical protein CABS01_02616 [Colletotrichum abscissum]
MPQFRRPRWPNPQDSCGHEILNTILTRKKAWFANGLALEKYSTDLEPNLQAALNSLGLERGEIYVRLYMIGRAETTSEPTIMVCCMNESIRSRVKNELRANPTLRACREFLVHGLPHPLEQLRPARPLAGTSNNCSRYEEKLETDLPSSVASGDEVFSPTASLSLGRRLFKPPNDNEAILWATGGVFLHIDGACLQLTAEHGPSDLDADQDSPSTLETDLDAFSINGSEDDEEEESLLTYDVLSQGSITPKRSFLSQRSFSINQSESSSWDNESSIAEDWPCGDDHDTGSDAEPSRNSGYRTRNAIDDIQHLEATKSVGVISIRASQGSSPGLDYALIHTPPPKPCDSVNGFTVPIGNATRSLYVCRSDLSPPGEKKILIVGDGGSIRTGDLPPGTTLFKRTGLNSFQHLQIVRLIGSNFVFGDSGGAVLDQESGAFYGHVVSGSPGTGIGYLVPATEVFQDLSSRGFQAELHGRHNSQSVQYGMDRSNSWLDDQLKASKFPRRDASTQTENALLPTPPLSQVGSDSYQPRSRTPYFVSPIEFGHNSFRSRWPYFVGPERSVLATWFNDRLLDDLQNIGAEDLWSIFFESSASTYSRKIEALRNFCRTATLESLERDVSKVSKVSTIWLDQREHHSLGNRSTPGALTAGELFKQLKLKRFGERGYVDADRRIIFVQNLDPSSVLCLATTCSRTERDGLGNVIYRHMMFRPHFGVTLRSSALQTFDLEFHIPMVALRSYAGKAQCSGSPIEEAHQSTDVSFLFPVKHGSSTSGISQFLHQSQVSLLVTGFDENRWTAFCFVHSPSEDQEDSIPRIDDSDEELLTDPVSCGKLPVGMPWDPREYFLAVLRVRLKHLAREWDHTMSYGPVKGTQNLVLKNDILEAQDRLRRSQVLIMHLIYTIAGTLAEWDKFQEDALESYFDDLQNRKSFSHDACRRDMLKSLESVKQSETSLRKMKDLCISRNSQYSLAYQTSATKAYEPTVPRDRLLKFITMMGLDPPMLSCPTSGLRVDQVVSHNG